MVLMPFTVIQQVSYNTANGVQALYSNTTGINNTANGRVCALYLQYNRQQQYS